MKPLFKFPAIIVTFALLIAIAAQAQPGSNISTTFDAEKNRTTVRLAPTQLARAKGQYDSLSFSVFFSYPGKTKRRPEVLSLELLTVVKARQLDSDLYVVFLIDGEEIFLSSDRSAVLNPVPGKRWIGERLVFRLPYETFLKFARARKLSVRFDARIFDFEQTHLNSLREFARQVKD